jgi:hypothetical protein
VEGSEPLPLAEVSVASVPASPSGTEAGLPTPGDQPLFVFSACRRGGVNGEFRCGQVTGTRSLPRRRT